jgi:hypothetical protein
MNEIARGEVAIDNGAKLSHIMEFKITIFLVAVLGRGCAPMVNLDLR